jgi:hypothetical protein
MFEPNPTTVRFYHCDRCGRIKAVTVIASSPADDVCDCGGIYSVLTKEIKL